MPNAHSLLSLGTAVTMRRKYRPCEIPSNTDEITKTAATRAPSLIKKAGIPDRTVRTAITGKNTLPPVNLTLNLMRTAVRIIPTAWAM